jgi:site-specific recombinase XerD
MEDSKNPTGALTNSESALVLRGESSLPVPALVSAAGEEASAHFLNFFLATIRNRNTRRAYGRQVGDFLRFLEERGLSDIRQIRTEHVAFYIELLTHGAFEPASVKQALSSIRMLFDYLVVKQVVAINPAASVRGPKLSVTEGKTPSLESAEVVRLFESIPTNSLVGLRDRALIGLMAYTFARVGAALAMNVSDFYPQGTGFMVRLREKGGKRKVIAAHHLLVDYLTSYIEAAGIGEERDSPLFRTAEGKTGRLTKNRMTQDACWYMLQRRARKAGITTAICNHTFRATGITNYLENGGARETAQHMAGHADPRTTQLYDRRKQLVTRSEVERIRYEQKV